MTSEISGARIWRALWHSREALVGLVILSVFVILSALAPVFAPHSPFDQNLADRLLPPFWDARGTLDHYLGTDQLGRDILSRLFHGGRITLIVGFACTLVAGVVGTLLGVLAGYAGGTVDSVIMRVADVQLSLPFIVLAIALVAVFGPSLANIIIILGLTSWVRFARVTRAETLVARELDYVEATIALGASHWRAIWRHIIPNIASIIIVVATLEIPRLILMESALSFLGLGVQPPFPSWGAMASEGRSYIKVAWWLTAMPGLAITLVVLSINLVGDWLRDAIDVKI